MIDMKGKVKMEKAFLDSLPKYKGDSMSFRPDNFRILKNYTSTLFENKKALWMLRKPHSR
jgi:hypothetical protein